MARPRTLTPELQVRLTTWLRAGNSIGVACKACQIGEATFHEWMKRGAADPVPDGDEVFAAFRVAVELAEDEWEAAAVAMVQRSAQKGSWQAAAWLLERRAPERWGKPVERLNGLGAAAHAAPAPDIDPFDVLTEVTDEVAAARGRRAAG